MKSFFGLLLALGLLACAIAWGPGCATGPNPCIGSAQARLTMSCTCPGTLNPACPPWPSDDPPSWSQDAKKPTDGGITR
jgi:hypothetical protein